MRSIVALLLILGQQNLAPQPTFKSGINLVEVDVVVLDKQGAPIRGLRQQDFATARVGNGWSPGLRVVAPQARVHRIDNDERSYSVGVLCEFVLKR